MFILLQNRDLYLALKSVAPLMDELIVLLICLYSLIGKAFEQAAENTQTEITSVFFDSSGMKLHNVSTRNPLGA